MASSRPDRSSATSIAVITGTIVAHASYPEWMKHHLAFSIVLLCAPGATARAQPAEDPDAVVKALFPRDDEIPHWRLRDIADRLGSHPGSQVADVGCGEGQIALVWSRVVGPTGHVWAEDIDPHALKAARKLMKEHGARNVTVL